jgi:hypothetical protein
MEHLTEKVRQSIIKMSTARLVVKLTRLGFDKDVLADLERKELISIYAQAVADGKEEALAAKATPGPPIGPTVTYNIEIEKLRISTEMQRHADLIALEKQKLVLEQQHKQS